MPRRWHRKSRHRTRCQSFSGGGSNLEEILINSMNGTVQRKLLRTVILQSAPNTPYAGNKELVIADEDAEKYHEIELDIEVEDELYTVDSSVSNSIEILMYSSSTVRICNIAAQKTEPDKQNYSFKRFFNIEQGEYVKSWGKKTYYVKEMRKYNNIANWQEKTVDSYRNNGLLAYFTGGNNPTNIRGSLKLTIKVYALEERVI